MDIIMKTNKTLVKRNKINIYRNESNCDVIRFLIPREYNELDLSEFTPYLIYTEVSGTKVVTELLIEDELFEDQMLQAYFNIDSDFTVHSGNVIMQLMFEKDDCKLYSGKTSVEIQ